MLLLSRIISPSIVAILNDSATDGDYTQASNHINKIFYGLVKEQNYTNVRFIIELARILELQLCFNNPILYCVEKNRPIMLDILLGAVTIGGKHLIKIRQNIAGQIYEKTLLIHAAQNNYYDMTKVLLKHGVNVNETIKEDKTALHYACFYMRHEIIELLLKNGAFIHAPDSTNKTPLFFSAIKNDPFGTLMLCNNGANVNHLDSINANPIFYTSCLEVLSILVSFGANIDVLCDLGFTPLIYHLLHKKTDIAYALVNNGANVLINNPINGNTPLFYVQNDCSMAEILLENGVPLNGTNHAGYNALIATVQQKPEQFEFAKFLVVKGIDINQVSLDGTAVYSSYLFNNMRITKFLIEAGAQLNCTKPHGMTLLMMACQNNDAALVKMLLAYGANPNVCNNEGITALVQSDDYEIIRMLLYAGANVNIIHKDTSTPLIIATEYNLVKIVELFLEYNVDKTHYNNEGYTALDIAKKENHAKIVALLQQ
jgi:ankyrin repeat protein